MDKHTKLLEDIRVLLILALTRSEVSNKEIAAALRMDASDLSRLTLGKARKKKKR